MRTSRVAIPIQTRTGTRFSANTATGGTTTARTRGFSSSRHGLTHHKATAPIAPAVNNRPFVDVWLATKREPSTA